MELLRSVYEMLLKSIEDYYKAGRVPPQCVYDTIAKIESVYYVQTGKDIRGNQVKEPKSYH